MKLVKVSRNAEIKPIENDLNDFSALGVSSFDFWNNKDDDIYDKFYNYKKI